MRELILKMSISIDGFVASEDGGAGIRLKHLSASKRHWSCVMEGCRS
jgi:hypothetical protein